MPSKLTSPLLLDSSVSHGHRCSNASFFQLFDEQGFGFLGGLLKLSLLELASSCKLLIMDDAPGLASGHKLKENTALTCLG